MSRVFSSILDVKKAVELANAPPDLQELQDPEVSGTCCAYYEHCDKRHYHYNIITLRGVLWPAEGKDAT